MNPWQPSQRFFATLVMGTVAITAAAGFWIGVVGDVRRQRDVKALENACAAFRPLVYPGMRVTLIQGAQHNAGERIVWWFVSQYALAPAFVRSVGVEECGVAAGACRLQDADAIVAVRAPDVGRLVTTLPGLRAVSSSGPLVWMTWQR